MFGDVREEKYSKIEEETNFKKLEVNYVIKVAKEHYDKLVELFAKDIDENNLEEIIFGQTKRLINKIPEYYKMFGIGFFSKEHSSLPEVALGWVNCNESGEEPFISYNLSPSEKGLEVLDGFRAIRGKIPYLEAVRSARERVFSIIQSS